MLEQSVSDLITAGLLSDAQEVLERIAFTTSLDEAVAGADHVQESIPERVALKRALFETLDKVCPDDVTLASSTSELMPSSFLRVDGHPERCLVAHPVNPPSLIPLVELCPAPRTSDRALKNVTALLDQCGMSCITLKREISGFILNRLQAAVLGEAFSLIDQGYCSSDDIDRVMTEGLARRWSFIGPMTTGHLNASAGFAEYMAVLGDTWDKLILSMRGSSAITPEAVDRITRDMNARIPVSDVPKAQAWRDRRLIALAQHLESQPAFGEASTKGHADED